MNSPTLQRKFRLGLCVNAYAGIGGALALKGSDGADIRAQALSQGAPKLAPEKAKVALEQCRELFPYIELVTGSGELGADIGNQLGLTVNEVYQQASEQTEDSDSIALATAMLTAKVDLLLFVGGDGTARNIYQAVGDKIPVLGVPAGCKIHSGVYAITPKAAGKVLKKVVSGELVSLRFGEVKDIDEEKFRQGIVTTAHYGEMQIPHELEYIQAVKMAGKESDELVLDDICDYVIELMEDLEDHYFIMGSGSTVAAIMQKLELPNTLLGVDVIYQQQVLASDVNAQQLLEITNDKPCKLIVTAIGGQGHLFGRGNQQLSPELIKRLGKQNMVVVATKTKLNTLGNNGLVADTSDPALDASLAGPIDIITGYRDHVLYFIRD